MVFSWFTESPEVVQITQMDLSVRSLSPPQVNVIHHKPITVDKSNHTVASGSNVTVNVATDHTSW